MEHDKDNGKNKIGNDAYENEMVFCVFSCPIVIILALSIEI